MTAANGFLGRVVDFFSERLRMRTQRRAALGEMIDFLLEVRHRDACIVRVEEELGSALASVPPRGRVVLRLVLGEYFECILPPLRHDEFEELRRVLAKEEPVTAFRLRAVGVAVRTLLAPALAIAGQLPDSDSEVVMQLLEYAQGEASAARLSLIDDAVAELAEAHGSRTAKEVEDYYRRFREGSPELQRMVLGLASVLRDPVNSLNWHDSGEAILVLRQSLRLPPRDAPR